MLYRSYTETYGFSSEKRKGVVREKEESRPLWLPKREYVVVVVVVVVVAVTCPKTLLG
jgi:hypothetical protein